MLTYLGRRSIAMGTCRSIVIDAILKSLAKLLAPISSKVQGKGFGFPANAAESGSSSVGSSDNLWTKTDLQLISWLLLFLSVCLDDCSDRKDKCKLLMLIINSDINNINVKYCLDSNIST